MKTLITLAFLITTIVSTSLFASSEVIKVDSKITSNKSIVYPQITVWPNGIDVRVWNHTDKDVRCSGSINIRTMTSFRTEFYNSVVYRGMTDYRRFNNWNPNDRYMSAHHSIYCYSY
jgi:hypothetical protein